MSIIQDRVNTIVDGLDMGKAVFDVSVQGRNVSVREKPWDSNLDREDFTESLVDRGIRRYFDKKNMKYYIDKGDVVSNIEDHIRYVIMDTFMNCSPYDQPRRSKAYKSFREMLSRNKRNSKFLGELFSIQEYYFNSTRTDSIKHPDNDVHRKNIYHLLCLMEKSYGKTSSN